MCSCFCIFPHTSAVMPVSRVGIFLFISYRTVCGLSQSRTEYGSAHRTPYWFVNASVCGPLLSVNPLTPELHPYEQRCLTRFFTGDFVSWTVYFVNICVKNQQIHQLFIQFVNYVW
jgi:hypothetical protein